MLFLLLLYNGEINSAAYNVLGIHTYKLKTNSFPNVNNSSFSETNKQQNPFTYA